MAGHDLAAVEAALLEPRRPRRRRRAMNSRIVPWSSGWGVSRWFGSRTPTGRRAAASRCLAAAAPAPVRDLGDARHVVRCIVVGELPQVRDHAVVEQLDAVPVAGRAGGVDAGRAEAHHEADAAARLRARSSGRVRSVGMPSSARLSAWALQQMRFLIVRGPMWMGEKSVGKAVVMRGPPFARFAAQVIIAAHAAGRPCGPPSTGSPTTCCGARCGSAASRCRPCSGVILLGTGLFLTLRLRFVQVARFREAARGSGARGGRRRRRQADAVPGLHDRARRLDRHRQHRGCRHRRRLRRPRAPCSGSGATASSPPPSSSARPCSASAFASWRASVSPPVPCTTCGTACARRALAWIYALVAGIAALTTTPFTQPNSMALVMQTQFGLPTWRVGRRDRLLAWLVIIGGVKSIGRAAERLSPLKVFLYLAGGLFVIATHIRELPGVIAADPARGLLDRRRGGRHRRGRHDGRHALRHRPRRLRQRGRLRDGGGGLRHGPQQPAACSRA